MRPLHSPQWPPALESFIGDCPIVGQNIAFDIEFLLKKGMPLSNPPL